MKRIKQRQYLAGKAETLEAAVDIYVCYIIIHASARYLVVEPFYKQCYSGLRLQDVAEANATIRDLHSALSQTRYKLVRTPPFQAE